MPRNQIYASPAERQKAYRCRTKNIPYKITNGYVIVTSHCITDYNILHNHNVTNNNVTKPILKTNTQTPPKKRFPNFEAYHTHVKKNSVKTGSNSIQYKGYKIRESDILKIWDIAQEDFL